MRLDKETQEVFRKSEAVKSTLASEGWVLMTQDLRDRLNKLSDINDMDFTKPDAVIDGQVRQKTVKVLKEWLSDWQTIVNQYEISKQGMQAPDYIINLDNNANEET